MKSTEYWKNVFKNWANGRNFQANLEEYESNVLDQILSQFYAELRKENGDNYEPDCPETGEISKIKKPPCGASCPLSTLAYEDDKSTTKLKVEDFTL